MSKKTFFFLTFFYILFIMAVLPIVVQFFFERQNLLVINYPLSVFFNGCISFFIYIFAIQGRVFEKPIARE
ncbi:hypothetical protein, partial [uncultured Treponema sp.]|uniref:hypothetical protein n=1 Tax=uncultured Treponema sp. TaxID=162155 RepID=UPI0025CBEC9D